MKYDIVKKSIEEFVIANWVMTPINSIQFDDVAFNSDLFSEYVQLTVRFGDAQKRSLAAKCYRQIGLVIFTVKTRPDHGSDRKLKLARAASEMFMNVRVPAVPVPGVPTVNLREPDLFDDTRARDGFVMAQVSCPFYYDLEY